MFSVTSQRASLQCAAMEMWQTTGSGIFRKSISIFLLWRRRASTRRTLRYLDPRLLTDVGLSAREREQECAQWFWQGQNRCSVAYVIPTWLARSGTSALGSSAEVRQTASKDRL